MEDYKKKSVSFLQALTYRPGTAHSSQISLHICQKYRHSAVTEGLCQHLKGDRLSGSRCSGDHSMSVCHFRVNKYLFFS